MPLDYKITSTVTTAATESRSKRYFHGTNETSAMSIVEFGVSYEQAKLYGTAGTFWTTDVHQEALFYAKQSAITSAPCIVAFDLPDEFIALCLENGLKWIEEKFPYGAYEFFPASFSLLNTNMANVEITNVSELL